MDIDKLTIGQAKELASMFGNRESNKGSLFEVGKAYFIRTVTYHVTGRVIKIGNQQLLLEDASWIADSGRFYNAMETGELLEVEPFTAPVIINETAVVDAVEWKHDLPREQR